MRANIQRPIRALLRLAGLVTIFLGLPFSWPQVGRAQVPPNAEVRIGVLGLFHPTEIKVSASDGEALLVRAGAENVILEQSSGVDSATVRLRSSEVVVTTPRQVLRGGGTLISGRKGEPVHFNLSIPGKITRRYFGRLEIRRGEGNLLAIVTVDLESAVASVVAAESVPDTGAEALKAQAVAARSYFLAGRGRHREFDFCDTTHCQFFRDSLPPESVVAKAVSATRGLVLAYESRPFAAMYTRSCSGHTRTPAQLGLSAGAYPYYSVECEYCRSHLSHWTSRISARDAASLRNSNESARLTLVRQLGWSSVPSNDFVAKKDGDQVVLEGTGYGHGIGLCQAGAKAMAEHGASFREILSHYYPNATILMWATTARSD